MTQERRGGRVAEGAPLLRAHTIKGRVEKYLGTYIRRAKRRLKDTVKYSAPRKSRSWAHYDDIYQMLIDLLDVRLSEPIDDWSRDEFDELREMLVAMQAKRRQLDKLIQK